MKRSSTADKASRRIPNRFFLATQFVRMNCLNRQTDSVKHEPCGLLGDADVAVNLVAELTPFLH